MNVNWLLLLLPLAAVGGWLFSWYEVRANRAKKQHLDAFSSSMMAGLNQLLSQEDDKALKTFLSISQAQADYPELQLTLGRLSRRKGEFERATTIHQSILDNAVYSNAIRELASYELAKDFYAAGLYDRAEEIFIELKNNAQHLQGAVKYLLEIYQHEKDWLSAIALLENQKIQALGVFKLSQLSHYYCEKAEEVCALGDYKGALVYAHQADSLGDGNPRTIILLGKISAHRGKHAAAVAQWKKLQWHEPHYLGEVIGHIGNSYEILGKTTEFNQFLKSAIRSSPDPRLIACLVESLKSADKPQSIKEFVQAYLSEKPTLGGVHQLMTNWLDLSNHKVDKDTALIVESISKLIANERNYACLECGFSADKHHWQCPACQQWEVIKPSHLLNTPLANAPFSPMTQLFTDARPKPSSSHNIAKPTEDLP